MIYAVNEETKKIKSFTTFAQMEDFIRKNQESLTDTKKKKKDPRKARTEIETCFKSEVRKHMIKVDNYTYVDDLSRFSVAPTRIV